MVFVWLFSWLWSLEHFILGRPEKRAVNMEKKFCPVCGSTDMHYGIKYSTANYYECKHCGYRGPIIIQDGKLADKLKERYAQEQDQS